MGKIPVIEIVRRAYQIWENAGKPDGKDEEFYHQAERELERELEEEQKLTEAKRPENP